MKQAHEMWQKSMDDMNPFNVAVAVEKFLAFLVPANESVELLCLELFANGDYKGCRFRAK